MSLWYDAYCRRRAMKTIFAGPIGAVRRAAVFVSGEVQVLRQWTRQRVLPWS